MFEASHSFLPFDYCRVPYHLITEPEPAMNGHGHAADPPPGFGCLRRSHGGTGAPALYWALSRPSVPQQLRGRPGSYAWNGVQIFGHVLIDQVMRASLPADRSWRQGQPVNDGDGRVASIWTSDAGDIVLRSTPTR